jgi:hypothetical protein
MTETTRQHLAWLAGALALGWGLGIATAPKITAAAAIAYVRELDTVTQRRVDKEIAYHKQQVTAQYAGVDHALEGCQWRLIAAGVEP